MYFAMDMSSSTAAQRRPPFLTRLHTRAARLLHWLRRRRAGRPVEEGERARWAAERAVLLEDNAVARTEAHMLSQSLRGWETFVRDAVFYRAIDGRAAQLTAALSDRLNASLAEIEGLTEVEISELRLPTSPAHAPAVTLVRYDGPWLSEWRVRWEPPSAQAGGSITLRGRKFGVSFQLVMAVGSVRFDGLVRCTCVGLGQPPGNQGAPSAPTEVQLGLRHPPEVSFEIGLAGKALSLGSDTLRAWLQRQLDRVLRSHAVLPQAIRIPIGGGMLGGAAGVGGVGSAAGAGGGGACPYLGPTGAGQAAGMSARCGSGSGLAPLCAPVRKAGSACVPLGAAADASLGAAAGASVPEGGSSERRAALSRLLSLRLDMRTIDGLGPRWRLDEHLAHALGGRPLAALGAGRPEGTEEWEWATALVLAQLQLEYHDAAATWAALCDAQRRALPPRLMRGAMEAMCGVRGSAGAGGEEGAAQGGGGRERAESPVAAKQE
jgi:hypothetical protein